MILFTVPPLDRRHVHGGAGFVDDAGAVLELDVGAVAPDAGIGKKGSESGVVETVGLTGFEHLFRHRS